MTTNARRWYSLIKQTFARVGVNISLESRGRLSSS